jgi:hypothetical protein
MIYFLVQSVLNDGYEGEVVTDLSEHTDLDAAVAAARAFVPVPPMDPQPYEFVYGVGETVAQIVVRGWEVGGVPQDADD